MDDLYWVAETGDTERLQYLLTARQCDINVQDWLKRTPLLWAAVKGHIQCAQLLLQHGADTSIQDVFVHNHSVGGHHFTGLHIKAIHNVSSFSSNTGRIPVYRMMVRVHLLTGLHIEATHNVSSFSSNTGRIPVYRISGR
ncbi:ankyrin repeat domain-containing protein 66-like [Lingula anatina]|uniref:Ankyrin repeat domain-containing protein 66-like n=1 Tax=Lingula anatina TaxID=7574 RepID=A0A2R2MP05_LINAN|nr:ankyrin repeat domain-containing protein 66-like [Lingula anatina]|eukprot:XP_023931960.1 ankyrin repeat domain-containing protein 66-like [Lingula anatina]